MWQGSVQYAKDSCLPFRAGCATAEALLAGCVRSLPGWGQEALSLSGSVSFLLYHSVLLCSLAQPHLPADPECMDSQDEEERQALDAAMQAGLAAKKGKTWQGTPQSARNGQLPAGWALCELSEYPGCYLAPCPDLVGKFKPPPCVSTHAWWAIAAAVSAGQRHPSHHEGRGCLPANLHELRNILALW